MCLTIPAKVIKIGKGVALIEDANSQRSINLNFVSDLKVGDWVLYINNMAVRKISRREASEISELLESFHSEIDPKDLSKKFRTIIEKSKTKELSQKDVEYLLQVSGQEESALFSEADVLRKTYLKEFICIHGIIEFSNYCKNDCTYCGLRNGNRKIKRYRMPAKEIVETAVRAVREKGYKLLVLQSGEDFFYSDDELCGIIKEIKKRAKVFIFMSVGERSKKSYLQMKKAGAAGILFRFETSNPKIFQKIHPRGKSLKKRMELIKYAKKIGYFVATGSIVGLPGQKIEDLAKDILWMKRYSNMASFGPFVPCGNTPLAKKKVGDSNLILKMIAILRLIKNHSRIPVVTALETIIGEEARRKALLAGANALMINLTPEKYRELYEIYPNRFFQKESVWEKFGLFKAEESYQMLEERINEEIKKK